MKTKKIVVIVLAAALAVCSVFGLLACNNDGQAEEGCKKGIIIVPGLFASALYDADTGKAVWDPFPDVDLWVTDFVTHGDMNYDTILALLLTDEMQEELLHLTANDGRGDGEGFLYRFTAMNDDGTSTFNITPYDPDTEGRLRYGMMNAQKEICDFFEEEYGDEYEVSVFNYDFRLDNRVNGKNLEDFIVRKGYEEVILASHSNGGPVVASYLARSQENRDRVSLYLSYDAPYLGSVTALNTLENIMHMVDGFQSLVEDIPIVSPELVQTAFETQFLPLLNMYTVYQLLPSFEMLLTPQYYYEMEEYLHTPGKDPKYVYDEYEVPLITEIDRATGETVERYFRTEDELYEFYCSRPWAHVDNDLNKELRTPMKDWLDYTNFFYVDTDDGTKFVTQLVNTVYFCGIGYDTTYNLEYITKTNGELRVYGDEDWQRTAQGDGTVLLYSAFPSETDTNRLVVVPFADHYDVVQRFDKYSRQLTLSAIEKYLKK